MLRYLIPIATKMDVMVPLPCTYHMCLICTVIDSLVWGGSVTREPMKPTQCCYRKVHESPRMGFCHACLGLGTQVPKMDSKLMKDSTSVIFGSVLA